MTPEELRKMGFRLPGPGEGNAAIRVAPSTVEAKSEISGARAQIRLAPLVVAADGVEATAGPVPNKTEARFEIYYRALWQPVATKFQPVRLRLNCGTYYSPDWLFVMRDGLYFFETKGAHIHKQSSLEKFKQARVDYPFWNFGFAQFRKGEWSLAGQFPQIKTT